MTGEERTFEWDYREQPPMADIAAAVAEISGGTVTMAMMFTGTDAYKLGIAQGNGERPAVFARFLRTMTPTRPDHEIADAWRYATPAECAFWRELETPDGDAP